MADIKKLSPIISKWEGGKVNDPVDKGGATNMGITIATWKAQGYDKDGDGDIDVDDLWLLDTNDFAVILKVYWDRWKAAQIESQNLANLVVDWVWGSGKWGIIIPQRVLGVKQDGLVGQKTLTALNSKDPKTLHTVIWNERKKFLENIVKNNPSQQRFIKGWLNRLNDFRWNDGLEDNIYKVHATALYVRTGPDSKKYNAIEVLMTGDAVTELQREGNWSYVLVHKSQCKGWLNNTYIS